MPSDIAPAPTEPHDTIRAPMLPPPGFGTDADEPVPFRLSPAAQRPFCAVPCLELLQAWLRRDPSHRLVERMAANSATGCYVVELRGACGSHPSETQRDLDSAIRTALMIASFGGDT